MLGTKGNRDSHYILQLKQGMDALKIWLPPVISKITPIWIFDIVKIEKKDMNITFQYCLGFISSNLISSQNMSILRHLEVVFVGSIIDRTEIDAFGIIVQEMLMKARQEQTFLSFPVLIT